MSPDETSIHFSIFETEFTIESIQEKVEGMRYFNQSSKAVKTVCK